MGRLSIGFLLILAMVLGGSSVMADADEPGPRMLRVLSPLSEGEVRFEGTVATVQKAGEVLVLSGETPYEVELPATLIVATLREASGTGSIVVELVEHRGDGDVLLARGRGPNVVLVEGLETPVTSFTRTFANPAQE